MVHVVESCAKSSLFAMAPDVRYCRTELPFEQLTLDHRVPEKRGGDSSLHNLGLACLSCNSRKMFLTEEEFLRAFVRKELDYAKYNEIFVEVGDQLGFFDNVNPRYLPMQLKGARRENAWSRWDQRLKERSKP
jgi:hypothetical protein